MYFNAADAANKFLSGLTYFVNIGTDISFSIFYLPILNNLIENFLGYFFQILMSWMDCNSFMRTSTFVFESLKIF